MRWRPPICRRLADIALTMRRLRQFQIGSLIVGIVAALACLCGAVFFDRAQFYRAWLPAYVFFLGIVLGSLAILMIYHLTGGAWGFLIRRILEAQIRTLPLLAVMYIPIGVGVRELYLWAQPEAVAHDHLLQRQQFYLNPEFFWCRSAVYLLLWLFLAWRLVSWSRRQDEEPNPQLRWSLQRFSEIGLVLFGTSMHFAAFDWLEMLQPSFHSTIFPMLVVAGQLLSAMACTLIVYRRICTWPDAAEVFSRGDDDLGNLQMTFLVVGVSGLVPVHVDLDGEPASGCGLVCAADSRRVALGDVVIHCAQFWCADVLAAAAGHLARSDCAEPGRRAAVVYAVAVVLLPRYAGIS